MVQNEDPSFQFNNSVSPRYVEPLLLQLQYGHSYSTAQFIGLLRLSGLDVKGDGIAFNNMSTWSLAGLGEVEKHEAGNFKKNVFRLSKLGKQLVDTYSTNTELFYDLMHFLFYSTYCRSRDIRRGRFWLYSSVSDKLWQEAPGPTDTSALTNQLQIEGREVFPNYDPSFSEQLVGEFSPDFKH